MTTTSTTRPGRPVPIRPALAQDFDPGLWRGGMMIAEKLDGVRAIWDGSSLRTREGRRIQCPDRLTAGLGRQMLDGELWAGRDPGDFDTVSGLVRSARPGDPAWSGVRLAVFDLYAARGCYRTRHKRLMKLLPGEREGTPVFAHRHRGVTDFKSAMDLLERVRGMGGEGIVIRDPDAAYAAGRASGLFRMKTVQDLDAVVTGYVPGEGRLSEIVGALVCRIEGGRGGVFRLGNGLSDRDRVDPPRVGQRVIVTHSGLTESGLPRLPVYKGVRGEQRHGEGSPLAPNQPPPHDVPRVSSRW